MPVFLVGATKWTGALCTRMGNVGEADSGIETRSPIWDMLSLRCCWTSKLKCLEVYIHGSGAQKKVQDGKNMDMRVICILINEVIAEDMFIQEEPIKMKRRRNEC